MKKEKVFHNINFDKSKGLEKINILVLVFINFFLLFLLFIKPEALRIYSSSFDLNETLYFFPIKFILNFTTIFSVSIVSYSVCNLIGFIYFKEIRKKIANLSLKMIVSFFAVFWVIALLVLLQVIFSNFFLIPPETVTSYMSHESVHLLADSILGACLGFITSLFVVRMKDQVNKARL